jgi:hypothetical protein
VVIDGNLLVTGSVIADKLAAGTANITSANMQVGIGDSESFVGKLSGLAVRKTAASLGRVNITSYNDLDTNSTIWGHSRYSGGTGVSGSYSTSAATNIWYTLGALGYGFAVAGVYGEAYLTGSGVGGLFRKWTGADSGNPTSTRTEVKLATWDYAIETTVGGIKAVNLVGGATTLSVDANGQIIRTPSDARLKSSVKAIPYGLNAINALRPVIHDWLDPAHGTTSLGLIAQEVQEVVPEVVSGAEYLSVDYAKLVPVLIAAVQDLARQLEVLQSDRKVSRSECGP